MRQIGNRPSAKVADTGRMWTKSIWDDIPWTSIVDGEREGMAFFDDFRNMPALNAGDLADTKYASFGQSLGTTLQQDAGDEHGAVAIATDGGDEDEGWIQTGGNTGGNTEFILQATGVPHTIAFEARVKKSVITSGCMFVGLAQQGLAANNTMVDTTGVMIDANWIGFQNIEATPATMMASYRANGVAQVDLIDDYHTLVNDTYVKVGFIYNYKNSHAQQIKFYKNGVIQTTYVTKAQIDALSFPYGEELAPLFGLKATTAVVCTATMDWWKCAMVVNS